MSQMASCRLVRRGLRVWATRGENSRRAVVTGPWRAQRQVCAHAFPSAALRRLPVLLLLRRPAAVPASVQMSRPTCSALLDCPCAAARSQYWQTPPMAGQPLHSCHLSQLMLLFPVAIGLAHWRLLLCQGPA